MMERAESCQKLYTRMRLWEFPDEYVIEPTDGSSASSLSISRVDASINLIGGLLYLVIHLVCLHFQYWSLVGKVLDDFLDVFICSLDGVPECSSIRVPKIQTIFGVVGMLKLVAGMIVFSKMSDFFILYSVG